MNRHMEKLELTEGGEVEVTTFRAGGECKDGRLVTVANKEDFE